MKKLMALVLALVCAFGLAGCSQQEDLRQGDYAMKFFFVAKVVEVREDYLLLEVFDTGNSNLSKGAVVEVSTDVASADGCPEFVVGECANVLMERNTEDSSAERLEAFSIYKTDEMGRKIVD